MKTDCDLSRIQYKLSKYNFKALYVIYVNFIQLQFIEKVHLDDLDLYVITFTVLATSVLL